MTSGCRVGSTAGRRTPVHKRQRSTLGVGGARWAAARSWLDEAGQLVVGRLSVAIPPPTPTTPMRPRPPIQLRRDRRRSRRRTPIRGAAGPWPSPVRPARNSLAVSPGAPRQGRPADAPAPPAHGGGAAQSRGGFRQDWRVAGARGLRHGPIPGRDDPMAKRHGGRSRLGPIAATPGVRGLSSCPILEGRADREGARQAVGFLVRESARCRWRFREAAVAMVGARRPRLAIVAKGDERTGRGTVHAGQPSLSHPLDDTRLYPRRPFRDGVRTGWERLTPGRPCRLRGSAW